MASHASVECFEREAVRVGQSSRQGGTALPNRSLNVHPWFPERMHQVPFTEARQSERVHGYRTAVTDARGVPGSPRGGAGARVRARWDGQPEGVTERPTQRSAARIV